MLFIMGACFGSFLCCESRRLHHRAGKHKKLPSRSICLHCRKQLKWYDNIPIISWLILRGHCRHCGKPIGLAEFLSEFLTAFTWLALGISFVVFTHSTVSHFSATPYDWAIFIASLVFTLPLIFLAIYDALYGELPVSALIIAIIIAVIILVLREASWLSAESYLAPTLHPSGTFTSALILQPLGAFLILGGLYLVLYLLSHGKWVGDGDWLLATAIALALSRVWPALLTLTLTNLLAVIIMTPLLRRRRAKSLPLGPFLVAAFFTILVFYPVIAAQFIV